MRARRFYVDKEVERVTGLERNESEGIQASDHLNEHHVLAPPEPRDRPGTRPKLDLDVVRRQVQQIQEKLAAERRERK